jgi:hypothetical protein
MAENTETRRTAGNVETIASAVKAASDAENTVKLYSDCYVGESMTQHYLYGIKATLTKEGFPCIDAPPSLVKANKDRNYPLLDDSGYEKLLERIAKAR